VTPPIQFLTRENPIKTNAAAANTNISFAGNISANKSPAPKAAKTQPAQLHRFTNNTTPYTDIDSGIIPCLNNSIFHIGQCGVNLLK
jgi:hypothetical protein